jgi:hypothetical protein
MRPDSVHQRSLRYQFAVMFHKIRKNVKRLHPQRYFLVAAAQQAMLGIQREISK